MARSSAWSLVSGNPCKTNPLLEQSSWFSRLDSTGITISSGTTKKNRIYSSITEPSITNTSVKQTLSLSITPYNVIQWLNLDPNLHSLIMPRSWKGLMERESLLPEAMTCLMSRSKSTSTRWYFLESCEACRLLPLPVGPSSSTLGVWGAAVRGRVHRKLSTNKKKETVSYLISKQEVVNTAGSIEL